MMIPDEDVASGGDHQVVTAKEIRRDAEAHVAQPLAEQQQTIRLLDELPQRLGADRTQIGADKLLDGASETRLGPRTTRPRKFSGVQPVEQPRLQAEPMNLYADDEHGQPCPAEPLDDFCGGLSYGGSSTFSSTSLKFGRHRDVHRRHITWNFEIDRTLEFERHIDGSPYFCRGRSRVIHNGCEFNDLLIHAELGLERFHLVMHEQARFFFKLAGPARNHNQRGLFRIGTGDRVHHVESARAIGDGQTPRPLVTRAAPSAANPTAGS